MARSSRQRGEMICTVCQTRTSPLWRRGDKGEVLCNACGLYHKHHKKPRPISLANSSARSARRASHQNNETKVQNQRYPSIYPNPNMMNSSMRSFSLPQTIAPALTPVNATSSNLNLGNNMSSTLQQNMLNNGNNMYNSSTSYTMKTLSPTFKMTSNINSNGSMPIPIKNNIMTNSLVASPPLTNSLSPLMNTPPHYKVNSNSNQNNNELMNPAPIVQRNNSEYYYSHDNFRSMDTDSDNETRCHSKASISSIINVDTPNNDYQNKYNNYNPLLTPLSSSPSMIQNDDSYYGQSDEDIEAAHLLISLRNCEKVC